MNRNCCPSFRFSILTTQNWSGSTAWLRDANELTFVRASQIYAALYSRYNIIICITAYLSFVQCLKIASRRHTVCLLRIIFVSSPYFRAVIHSESRARNSTICEWHRRNKLKKMDNWNSMSNRYLLRAGFCKIASSACVNYIARTQLSFQGFQAQAKEIPQTPSSHTFFVPLLRQMLLKTI